MRRTWTTQLARRGRLPATASVACTGPSRCLSFATRDPRDRTRDRSRGCGRERIDRVRKSIRREELADLRDSGGLVAVKCEFCSTEYACDDRDLDRLYASMA